MNLKRISGLANKAKQTFDEHGGTERLKHDAERLKDIAKGPGTAKEKAKAAGEALRHRDEAEQAAPASPAPGGSPGNPPAAASDLAATPPE